MEVHIAVLLIVVQVVTAQHYVQPAQSAVISCPRACFCSSHTKIVYCAKMGLTAIPANVSPEAHELNLNSNWFANPTLQRANFSSLRMLAKLTMSECGIDWIQPDTFRDLIHLTWLDLSANRLRHIQPFTFRGLSLQQLFLSANRHLRLGSDSFAGLSVSGIYLQDTSLAQVFAETFYPLSGSLKVLWLDGNALERLSSDLLPVFSHLKHLRLGANPLHCGCHMAWLKELYDTRKDLFQDSMAPACSLPTRLRGRSFSDVSAAEMRCQIPVFSNINIHFDGRLRCSAQGDPPPTVLWVRPTGETRRYLPSATPGVKLNDAILTVDSILSSASSGMYTCIAANDFGNVTLTVNVTWPPPSSTSLGIYQGQRSRFGTDYEEESDISNEYNNDDNTRGVGVMDDLQEPSISSHVKQSAGPRDDKKTPLHTQSFRSTPVHSKHVNLAVAKSRPESSDNDSDANSEDGGGHEEGEILWIDRAREARFNVLQLTCAVACTHAATLVLCLLVLALYERRRRARRTPPRCYAEATNDRRAMEDKKPIVSSPLPTATPRSSPCRPVSTSATIKQPLTYLTFADYTE